MFIRLIIIATSVFMGYLIGVNGAFNDGYSLALTLQSQYCNRQIERMVNDLNECQKE